MIWLTRHRFSLRLLASTLATLLFWAPVRGALAQEPAAEPAESASADVGDVASDAPVGEAAADAVSESSVLTEADLADLDPETAEALRASLDAAGDTGASETPAEPPSGRAPIALPSGEAKSAVTPQAISLPNAEGSIEGMGESFSPVLSSGTGTFSVPIALPSGRAGVAPSLGLSYSTSGGDSSVGFGWSLSAPFISRQTDRGLPRYDDRAAWHPEEDRFIYNGGQELVPVDSAAMATVDSSGGRYPSASTVPADVRGWQAYRARVEGAFMRFFRSPDSRRWVVQGKDGTRFDFGLLPSAEGPVDLDRAAALETEDDDPAGRVSRWLLTRMSDAHGSSVYYQYRVDEGARYLADLFYLSPADCAAGGDARLQRACTDSLGQYGVRVHLEYETRPDAFTRYVTGWRIRERLRLRRVTVTAAEDAAGTRYLVRRYHLTYQPGSFLSVLQSVQVEGRPDHLDPGAGAFVSELLAEDALGDAMVGELLPPMRFRYSGQPASGPQIDGFGGFDATVHEVVNSPRVSVDAARADLMDVNGDGLPDLLVTDPARYRTADGRPAAGVFFNGFDGADATPAGEAAHFSEAVSVGVPSGLSGVLNLASQSLLPMDVNGDGRGDLLHFPRLDHYGFFTPTRDADGAVSEVSPARQGWRFTYARVELPGVGGSVSGGASLDPRVDLLRDGARYKAFDVNNDHLVDIVRTTGTVMQTWLNLGWVPGGEGRFGTASYREGAGWRLSTDPIESCLLQDGLPLDFADPEVRLADMNGDGVQDIVKIRRGRLVYWPGRGTASWGTGPMRCARGEGAGRGVRMASPPPELNPDLDGVYLADVNADGATDVVQVRFRDLDIWLNRAGESFTHRITLRMPFAPAFQPNVRFTDIDGSGTMDLLYAQAGHWQYVDLLGGQRPRLLVGVDNGLGATTELAYESSARDYLRDLSEADSCRDASCERFTWSHVEDACDEQLEAMSGECVHLSGGSPMVSTVVRSVTTNDHFGELGGGNVDNVVETRFAYHDGYYEGIEQEFRGFGAADALNVGDEDGPGYQPTQYTRTYFHQGRRPTRIASDRLADNPREALKGRQWRSETFDGAGVYLSTTLAEVRVRKLATGLDGRVVWYGYVGRTDAYRYDTAEVGGFASPLGGSFPSVAFEEVRGGSVVPASFGGPSEESLPFPIRSPRYALMRTTIDRVDNLGQVLTQTALGRVHAEDDAPGAERDFGEAIVSHSEPALINAAQWIWRTRSAFVDGQAASVPLGHTVSEYSAVGDLLHSVTEANLPAGGGFDFAGDADGAASYAQANQRLESSTRYDAWGNALESCAGADLLTDGVAACLRTARVAYDGIYSQLPLTESTAVSGGGSSFRYLSTTAVWDRGFGVLRSVTDPNGDTTQVAYDGLARLSYLRPPTVPGCDMGQRPPQRFFYDLVPGGRPVSVIRSDSNEGLDEAGARCTGDLFIHKRSYVDGLGRTRASLTDTGSPARGWEKAGVPLFTRRGTSYRACNNELGTVRGPDPLPEDAVRQPGTPCAVAYRDAFGRSTRSYERDGSWVSASVYHALSQEAWDARDLETGGPYAATPSTTRVDGHGRPLETLIENIQPDGTHEVYRLRTAYRADNAVVSVTRDQAASLAPGAAAVNDASGRARSLTRVFSYDTAGRRIAATDPDTDSRDSSRPANARTWRYLFNRVGDLAAVRDPRGCGDNFYYDVAGRLLGEDYVSCGEAQPSGLFAVSEVPQGSIGLGAGGAHDVDARSYYDDAPPFALDMAQDERPADAGHLLGRATGAIDRGARSLVAYDARGQALWSAVQMAMLPSANAGLATTLADPPQLDTADAPGMSPGAASGATLASIAYDAHSYQSTSHYDHLGRADGLTLPLDPDVTDAPRITGALSFDRRGLVASATLGLDAPASPGAPGGATTPILRSARYDADRRMTRGEYGPSSGAGFPLADTMAYDARKRPRRMALRRTPTEADLGDHPLGAVTVVTDTVYAWDAADNLLVSADLAPASQFPAGYRPRRQTAGHDALYRVTGVATDYGGVDADGADSGFTPDDLATDWRDERERTNLDGSSHQQADPMHRRPAPMASDLPAGRTADLQYRFDWLGNMTEWTDDAGAFYERSLGRQLLNGFDLGPEGRPGALYFSSNIRGASGDIDPTLDRGGWLSVSYGEGGNAETLTVHAQCHDADASTACYDRSSSFTTREDHLRTSCACAVEQHYQYRYDELNRLTEARRYDRDGVAAAGASAGSTWKLAARQRYGYDASNSRRVKETVQTDPDDPPDATALYVLPGDLERRGLVRGPLGVTYQASPELGTETQYLVAGARIVWRDRAAPDPSRPLDRDHRITMAMGDLLGSVSCVVDLESGDLIERSTYYPNGARETQQATRNQSLQLEPMGFTGKEADEEVGLVYFGQRYLIPRIARWSTPDPLQIHAMGGGEPFNSYHYISGNLLQATDPVGLSGADRLDAFVDTFASLPGTIIRAAAAPADQAIRAYHAYERGDTTEAAVRAVAALSGPGVYLAEAVDQARGGLRLADDLQSPDDYTRDSAQGRVMAIVVMAGAGAAEFSARAPIPDPVEAGAAPRPAPDVPNPTPLRTRASPESAPPPAAPAEGPAPLEPATPTAAAGEGAPGGGAPEVEGPGGEAGGGLETRGYRPTPDERTPGGYIRDVTERAGGEVTVARPSGREILRVGGEPAHGVQGAHTHPTTSNLSPTGRRVQPARGARPSTASDAAELYRALGEGNARTRGGDAVQ